MVYPRGLVLDEVEEHVELVRRLELRQRRARALANGLRRFPAPLEVSVEVVTVAAVADPVGTNCAG